MITVERSKANDIEFRLNLRRSILQNAIRRHLHQSDDPKIMAFANHMSEVEDWVEADLLNDLDIAQCNLELAELRAIDIALSGIKAGTYGVCVDCAEAISWARLNAAPTALRCVDCQEKYEKAYVNLANALI